jgi:hypothetical protein
MANTMQLKSKLKLMMNPNDMWIACLFVFEATASLLQMDIIPIIAMGNVITETITKGYTKPS